MCSREPRPLISRQVLILSYDEEGTIHYFESDEMTIANANWLLDCYKYHLQAASTKY